ncbi:MAG: D-ribose pyranase [Bacteroidota bacterium]
MKKTGILLADLSRVVANLGHGPMIAIGDAGLSVPPSVPCIDFAIRAGFSGFWNLLDTVLSEMEVERAVVAAEASTEVIGHFAEWLDVESVSHEALKGMSAGAVAVVRTGETVAYKNVVLVNGVVILIALHNWS